MRSVVLSRTRWSGFGAMILAALAGCGEPAPRVRLSPLGGACSRPVGGNLVKVTAYTANGDHADTVALDETVAIADFPADTEQIGVEVLTGGGVVGAAGKSAPLAFNDLADGATIPVFMAPPDGFCEISGMLEARAQPLVARAGDGALVVGGVGATGSLSTAEYYNPATATFSSVDVPARLVNPQGFAGAALAALPDGRVVLTGGPRDALVVFDPKTRAFAADPGPIESRAFHAAIAIDNEDVLLAGGCSGVAGSACAGVQRHQALRYRLNQPNDPDRALPVTVDQRIGARLFDLGIQLDGRGGYLLLGGIGDPGIADRFALDDATSTALAGGHAQPAALDGGAVLAAFADDAVASGAFAIYPPGGTATQAMPDAPSRKSMRLIALEDGRVAGFGGDAKDVLIYDPTHDSWDVETPAAPELREALHAPSLVRMADGTVLVLGGGMSSRAWLYRPSLIGPASGSVTVAPASAAGRTVLTAVEPASVTRVASAPQAWLLNATDDTLRARALVGGPRIARGSVVAVVHVRAGGVALIAQQTGPGQAIVAQLAPGAPPRLVRLAGGSVLQVCSRAPALDPFDPAIAVTLRLAISDHDARVSIDDREVLGCDLAATDRGSWGIASLGAGAQVAVDSVTVAR